MSSYDEKLLHWIKVALEEDIGSGDHSTLSCIPGDAVGKAILLIKGTGVLAGMAVAESVFKYMDPRMIWEPFKKDGEEVRPGDQAFVVTSRLHVILQCERLVLNTMQRMSGIASLTRQYVQKLAGYPARLLDTRKTTPNFRFLEKEVVRIGGGGNHRMGLYDMIMLKDNHIDYSGGINAAIEKAYGYIQEVDPLLKIEVETRNLDEVREALKTGKADRIMLDNFSPAMLRQAVVLIGCSAETEASGGISLENIEEFASTGVDFISVGSLIHQAQSIDMSLKAAR